MTSQDVDAILSGQHGDAFGILGPHPAEGGWEVRAFLPQAMDAFVLMDGAAHPMQKSRAEGFFVARFDGEARRYQLRLSLWNGAQIELDDPYRFPALISDFDLHIHGEGTQYESYRTMGAHITCYDGATGVRFGVWAPNAEVVSIVGDFNDWDERRHPMRRRNGGVWELFVPGVGAGTNYKYSVRSRLLAYRQQKADPYGFASEIPPKSASVVCDLDSYQWGDRDWMEARGRRDILKQPVSVYEVHLGSWLRGPNNTYLSYRDLAPKLVDYATRLGYTHLELLPVMEHPLSASWGYQVVGYYAPTSRFGAPQDFMYFVDCCHQAGIGIIVDWVPAHFPKDAHGLAHFDGTALYEHADPRKGEHRDWGTLIFNYGRNEVRTFLISNALFWLRVYHIDGLRVDAVASMLYLDYSRQPGEWIPNMYGGNENLEAIDFLRRFNELAHQVPGAITVAEESTAFTGVSRPTYLNGLGFTMKWNMGWMNDMLDYFAKDPVHRKYHHNNITFSMLYAFTENFVLPISHDEVVHGKRALLSKMPGDVWQRFANVRAFLAYMFGHPGKKLIFMGSEIGVWDEWDHERGLPWELLHFDSHRKLQTFVGELNRLYRSHPAFYEVDFHWAGFEWVDFRDVDGSTISFLRRPASGQPFLLFVCNFTPVPRLKYRVGVPVPGVYREIFNSDAEMFGGSNLGNGGAVASEPVLYNNQYHSLSITLPPLAVVVFESPQAG
ncbi:MAG TPA: 1,4-alpha-glucan branching protein GlgB [Bryobacteraceae bacterium]|nr:1,4-alpha-glucan branching protein GlgB [Bryobacteraceae bacterium]